MAVLYFNTGFDGVNVCGSYAALAGARSYRTEYIDLVEQLPQAVLRVPRQMGGNDPGSVDYVELSNLHYYVLRITWLDADVVQYDLAVDPFFDLDLDIIAGIVQRSPDSTAIIDDPYLTPIDPPQVSTIALWGKPTHGVYGVRNFVASTLDFSSFPDGGEDDVKDIVEMGEDNIVRSIWSPRAVATGTPISIFGPAGPGSYLSCVTAGYKIYNMDNVEVRRAIQIARNCGWESAILGAYQVPEMMVHSIVDNGANGIGGITIDTSRMVQYNMADYDPTLSNAEWHRVARKSPASGGGIISCASGSQLSLKPWQYGPLYLVADPRVGGCPTCVLDDPTVRAGLVDGNTAQVPWTIRSVQGAEWTSTPLTYVQASGINREARNLVRNQVYSMQKDMLDIQRAQWSGLGASLSAIPGVGSAAKSVYRQGQTSLFQAQAEAGMMPSLLSAGSTALGAMANTAMAADDIYNIGRARRQYEKDSYYIGVNYTAPQTVGVPQSTMQDYMGNGFICYFNTFSEADLNRWVEIAKMYGLSDNRPARGYKLPDDGAKCHYLQIAGCRLAARTMLARAAESMLAEGVRIWSTLPSEGVD